MKELYLNIGHIGLAENVLGSGKRLVIWVAGCPFRCPGCIQPDYLPKNSGKDFSISQLTKTVHHYMQQIDGITVSGGEPLWQVAALSNFLESLPSSLDKMVFTGYRIDELDESQLNCISKFDLVVDGRFEKKNRGNYLWRGSANQKFYSPTGKYISDQLQVFYNTTTAGLEIIVNDNSMYFYGIPTASELDDICTNLQVKQILLGRNNLAAM
jgi:anaerobic ribonucleoside-triphosphate reductase activating protein